MTKLFSLLILLIATSAMSKTILVSDVDDTIKISNVRNLNYAPAYVIDDSSPFLGMSDLYRLLKLKDPSLTFTYLSKGPSWLVGQTHTQFLSKNYFPAGTYIPRTNLSAAEQKVVNLRRILKEQKPDVVIMIGDNGEQDAADYHQIQMEFKDSKITFYTFIHQVYSIKDVLAQGSTLFPEQTGFVTSIDLALELYTKQIIPKTTAQAMITSLGPALVGETPGGLAGTLAFPQFIECDDFKWPQQIASEQFAGLEAVKQKIQKVCDPSAPVAFDPFAELAY